MTQNLPIVHLVLGPSSVGKSTFIHQHYTPLMLPIFMAYEIDRNFDSATSAECVVHYNSLRPFGNHPNGIHNNAFSEPVLRKLFSISPRLQVDFIVSDLPTLLKRIRSRKEVEPDLRRTTASYPKQDIFNLVTQLNLAEFYKKWIETLKSRKIKYRLIYSSESEFTAMYSEKEIFERVNAANHCSYFGMDF